MQNRHNLNRRLPYLLLAPSIIILLALILYPLGFALRNSFWFWNLQTSAVPLYHSGLDNYRMVFQVTPFTEALKNTLLLAGLGTLAQFWLGMGVALLLHTHLRGMGFCRALLIMPTTLAPVVAGFLFRYLLEPKGGLLPWLLEGIGFPVPPQGILGYAGSALFAIGMVDTWQWTPFVLLVVGAAIASIPDDLLEVAAIDGASRWKTFLYIELPLLMPLLLLTLVFRMLESLLSLDSIYSLTNGGPGYSTYTLTYYIYTLGLRSFDFGGAAASSWLFMIFATFSIGLVFWRQRKDW